MQIEILGFAGCPNFVPAVQRTRAALNRAGVHAEINEVQIESNVAANDSAFLGSPTVRVNGLDVEIAARSSTHFGFSCRTYVVNGIRHGTPPQAWIEAAIWEALHKNALQGS